MRLQKMVRFTQAEIKLDDAVHFDKITPNRCRSLMDPYLPKMFGRILSDFVAIGIDYNFRDQI